MTMISLYQELASLDGHSPADFVALRRRLIDGVVRPDGVPSEHLCELQQGIEHAMAVCATPRNRLRQLHVQLDERLETLAVLTQQLEWALGEQGPEAG